MNRLRIAQVAPLYESVPPKLYGGTERVVSFLTEELISKGHDVTLFASGDSRTTARLVAPNKKALRLDCSCTDKMAHHIVMLQLVQDRLADFDIIHYHIDFLHYPLSRLNPCNHVTTLHGNLNLPELEGIYGLYGDIPVISISSAQRKPLPWINWAGNVYHGIPEQLFKPSFEKGSYLAFLGRISREKGVDRAIATAIECGLPLKIAAKVDDNDKDYFEKRVKKLLRHPLIDFVGEIGENEKENFLGDAMALLFPIDWPEPFGLVMIESLACGTPVIAYRNGSVPEIIQHGRSGFIVDNQKDAARAVEDIGMISRRECRKAFEERFTAAAMASGYLEVYRRLLAQTEKKYDLKMMEL